MVTSPHWWDDKMLVTGKYEKDEFVARVMDHIADQYDGPVGSDPPTWDFPRMGAGSDKNQADAANFRRLSMGSAPDDDEDSISDEEKSDLDPEEAYTAVWSVVSIPKQAAEEAQENPKVAELKEKLINAYPRLFSGVANKNPPDLSPRKLHPLFSPKHLDFVTEKNSFFCHLENTVFQTLPKNAFFIRFAHFLLFLGGSNNHSLVQNQRVYRSFSPKNNFVG